MSVINPEALCNAITKWIEDRLDEAKATTAVVGLSGGADSALVAILCSRSTKFKTMAVYMPCQSSPSSELRALDLLQRFPSIESIRVKLDDAFESIRTRVVVGLALNTAGKNPDNASDGALRSCLRAPTLDYVAKLTNGLIVGTGNRDEDEFTRYFQKRGDGAVDISPIAKLHKSEVYELLRYLDCPASIIDAVPSADLWGPDAGQEDEKQLGMTYQEVEWGIRECDKYEFHQEWSQPHPPLSALEQFRAYTPRQVEVIKTLCAMESSTRHKARMPPVFNPRYLDEYDPDATGILVK